MRYQIDRNTLQFFKMLFQNFNHGEGKAPKSRYFTPFQRVLSLTMNTHRLRHIHRITHTHIHTQTNTHTDTDTHPHTYTHTHESTFFITVMYCKGIFKGASTWSCRVGSICFTIVTLFRNMS